MGSLLSRPGD